MKKQTPIAIVGMAGVFPGANNIDIFWDNIVNGRNAIDDIPDNRWIVSPESIISPVISDDQVLSIKAGLIQNFTFDPAGFAIDTDLLNQLDPMYHLVLTAGREALSGCFSTNEIKQKTGVILAAIALPTDSSSEFTREILGKSIESSLFSKSVNNQDLTNNRISRNQVLASRVTALPASMLAKGLGLGGGSYTLDAACSSSLYSIKLACDELWSKRSDMMLAGGVSRPESLFTQTGFTQLTALSPSGVCAPFDASADGLVVGEGAGIIILKRLDDAIRDGDIIHGLLHSAGLTNDIGGNLLAPDTKGQVRAMELAYKKAGWTPFDVDHIECHGTGTPVGDKIELSSMNALWQSSGQSNKQCAIGSVKSMIGHLLTAAGIAGTIKTILALKNKTIPPSLNFKNPAPGSPLEEGPFYVPGNAREWEKKSKTPRRAAMSAFGFGGINAHVLIEEWDEKNQRTYAVSETLTPEPDIAVAITGMSTFINDAASLDTFQKTVLNGNILTDKTGSDQKWRSCSELTRKKINCKKLPSGNYFEDFNVSLGEFHIPPNELPDILPQHLLMLKAAASALNDAKIDKRSEKPRMGTAIGMGFDFEATNFNLRWNLENDIEHWNTRYKLNLSDDDKKQWLSSLRSSHLPPLSPARTTGALGGIIASRVAKEFKLGGPSFIVSGEDTSGIKALEIGMQSIQNDESDLFLTGAVDLPGEIRSLAASHTLRPFSKNNRVSPFDLNANGPLPGEGAVAIVLKRLDKAIEDGDRIYAILKGTGSATKGGIDETVSIEAYQASLERTFINADVMPSSVSYIETHGSSNPEEDQAETAALNIFFASPENKPGHSIAIGSVTPLTGHTGAASGLTSVIKTSLCLFNEIMPPLINYKTPVNKGFNSDQFHLPVSPQYWLRDKTDGPRTACIGSMTTDGNCAHVILEAFEPELSDDVSVTSYYKSIAPLGIPHYGLFIVEGNDQTELLTNLEQLKIFSQSVKNKSVSLGLTAYRWFVENEPLYSKKHRVALISSSTGRLTEWINEAEKAVINKKQIRFKGPDGICYSPAPLGKDAGIAFVYPGSGNHYIGMGIGIGLYWPELLRSLDKKTDKLKSQLLPDYFMPQRTSWEEDWETRALEKADNNPAAAIIGQVSHGVLKTSFLNAMGITPSAVTSYSLGESAAYFATGTWTERDKMLERMHASSLFTSQLAGEFSSARKEWQIDDNDEFNWLVAFVNKPEKIVRVAMKNYKHVRLLIVNTPDECVIGGKEADVKALINALDCEFLIINGVVSVHCDAANPSADEYKKLHLLETTPPDNIKFYSCYSGKPFNVTKESAADSVLNQALHGFNFPKIITSAYNDGSKIFIETGPGASASRMIEKILGDKQFLSISACVKGEDEYLTAIKLAGSLSCENIPLNFNFLFQGAASFMSEKIVPPSRTGDSIRILIGGNAPILPAPPVKEQLPILEKINQGQIVKQPKISEPVFEHQQKVAKIPRVMQDNPSVNQMTSLIDNFTETIAKTADSHKKYIEFSKNLSKSFADTINFQNNLIEKAAATGDQSLLSKIHISNPFKNTLTIQDSADDSKIEIKSEPVQINPVHDYITPENILLQVPVEKKLRPEPAFSRKMCMEFAIGSIEKVLGPRFAPVDTYDVRVRLPDEPLMLVDRILSIEGEACSLKSGKIVTEHDVLPEAWYLDGGKAPVCISIEAGQADLFLCSYLGIDLKAMGKRSYRLLDAVAQFHSGLPKPGDTIRYEIEIDRFINQGETYLFFFHFNGFIGTKHIISMRNGCAGFFTPEEVRDSGGIVLTSEETAPVPGIMTPLWTDLVEFFDSGLTYSYADTEVNALRNGDPETAFGPQFKGKKISKSLSIPGGRMKLVDRVLEIDPTGGRYSLGSIKAQADIYPDSWFLTCHFVDDMVMPGTLMYECCMHTLRIFTMRMGWISDREDVCCEPVPDVQSVLKCRGPVTVKTKHVFYVIEIKEIGYNPEPFVIADAHMYAHDEHIVMFRDMSMKMSGTTKEEIEDYWL